MLGVSEFREAAGKIRLKSSDWAEVVLEIDSTEISVHFYNKRGTAER